MKKLFAILLLAFVVNSFPTTVEALGPEKAPVIKVHQKHPRAHRHWRRHYRHWHRHFHHHQHHKKITRH